MAKIQGLKEGKIYSNIYKEERTQPWSMGSKIYPGIHENLKAFFSSSSPILLESSIQYPCGVGLHQ
ncbi:hypothetical protein HKD37_10G028232 [Glycine soja]